MRSSMTTPIGVWDFVGHFGSHWTFFCLASTNLTASHFSSFAVAGHFGR